MLSWPCALLEQVTRNKKIVWKHRPDWQFYTRMLRTKLYWNPFFVTVHQNINKPKSRAVRTTYGPIFLPFYVIIVSFFSFVCQDANTKESDCPMIGCNLSKKHKLALYKTQSREPNYVDHTFFVNILLGATCTTTWGQTSKYYRAG